MIEDTLFLFDIYKHNDTRVFELPYRERLAILGKLVADNPVLAENGIKCIEYIEMHNNITTDVLESLMSLHKMCDGLVFKPNLPVTDA